MSLKRQLSTNERSVSPPLAKRRLQSVTTKTAIASFFTPASQKEPEKTSWHVHDETLLIARYGSATLTALPTSRPAKVAAFDFDSTLITSASGKKFSRDATDWKWWCGTVPATLKKLNEEGYTIVVISNQGGISLRSDPKSAKSDQKSLANFKGKVNAVFSQLDLPISLYAATARDIYRKPRTGMWERLLKDHHLLNPDAIDLAQCLFVGDAGGRSGHTTGNVAKDHACSDRDFAANVGIVFRTPEEYFLGEDVQPFTRTFDHSLYLPDKHSIAPAASPFGFSKNNSVDVVLFCGSPGSGKSTFYATHLRPLGYERVNQDILKTRERCLKFASEHLSRGESVAVGESEVEHARTGEERGRHGADVVLPDNTNADAETRAQWVKLAKQFDVPIRCILFTAEAKLCEHNDTVRALGGTLMNPEGRKMLPRVAFAGFASRYREPTLKEGFQDITKVDFEVSIDQYIMNVHTQA
ncbi:DNA kinase/phosphatase Pnk1 [Elasticomyces elasticus]|nr:DNA kinase/phosphatase Pnk1 [Elasticomyces elasticus]